MNCWELPTLIVADVGDTEPEKAGDPAPPAASKAAAIEAQFPAPPPVEVQVNVVEVAEAFLIMAQPLFSSFGQGLVSGVVTLERKSAPPPETALIVLFATPREEMTIPLGVVGFMVHPEKFPAAACDPLRLARPAVESNGEAAAPTMSKSCRVEPLISVPVVLTVTVMVVVHVAESAWNIWLSPESTLPKGKPICVHVLAGLLVIEVMS